ncbi:MAG: PEP-CTERM sorting domain-containing protein [Gammaproteobacteria bacterium]
MSFRSIVSAVLLCAAGACSAQDQLYTYTGNTFDHNSITAEPSQLIAHFVFDFDHSPESASGIYSVKHWDATGAQLTFSSAQAGNDAHFRFQFDQNMNVTQWNLWVFGGQSGRSGMMSLSSDSWLGAVDMVLYDAVSGPYATIYGVPGIWQISALPVPEPDTYAMLATGVALVAAARRAQRKAGSR